MSSVQKVLLLVVLLGAAVAGWALVAPASEYAAALPEGHHVVREVEGQSGSVFLHFKAWGAGGGHEAAWVSLDSASVAPDSTRDLLIRAAEAGLVYRVHGDTLDLFLAPRAAVQPPASFTPPLVVRQLEPEVMTWRRMWQAPDSMGVEVLR